MKKIGIVTSIKELNYGAILQAYALKKTIEKRGFEVVFLWWDNQKSAHHDVRLKKIVGMFWGYLKNPKLLMKSIRTYGHSFKKVFPKESVQLFEDFEIEQLPIEYLSYNQMKKFAYSKECYAIVAGSDQIWNSYAIYVDPFYYLQFVPGNKRIAYAPSLGKNDIPEYNKRIMKKYIEGFRMISIREEKGKKLLEKLHIDNVQVVLDPSLLLSASEWRLIRKNILSEEKYVLLYFLDQPNVECIDYMERILNNYNMKIMSIPYEDITFGERIKVQNINAGPREFLSLIDNADLVITDSFHGTAFSINFNKNFITFDREYGNNESQSSRIIDLLNVFGIRNRFLKSGDIAMGEIDYNYVNEKLENLRKESMKYLSEALLLR